MNLCTGNYITLQVPHDFNNSGAHTDIVPDKFVQAIMAAIQLASACSNNYAG